MVSTLFSIFLLAGLNLLTLAPLVVSEESSRGLFDFFSYQVINEWKQVDFNFPSENVKSDMIKNKTFVPENNIITAVKIYKNRMFLATPRYWSGVPSTLNVIKYSSSLIRWRAEKDPKLTPYPSWAMQKENDCSALQLVESMEIDQFGRLWIVDLGRTKVLEATPNNPCPAKLVIIDLNDRDKVVGRFDFPADVVSRTENLLKDINVACTSKTDCFAYIADMTGSLIVFDYKNQKSWAITHPTMASESTKSNFTINGKEVSVPFGLAGSVVSPKSQNFATFYYAAIASTSVHAVSTSVLNSPPQNRKLTDDQVTQVGERSGQSDGWAMDNQGTLYYGSLPENAVYEARTLENPPKFESPKKKRDSKSELVWPDTFAFDGEGWLNLVTNRFHLWEAKEMNWNEVNFRVVRFKTGTKAYSA